MIESRQYTDLMRPGAFIGATLVASGIKNAVIIFHGIAGCNIEAVHFRSDNIPGGNYVPIIPTGLNELDCIQGGYDKLVRTLRDAIAQRPPEIAFVFTSDATSIVGDDIQTAARTVSAETGVNIIALDVPGFLGGITKGVDAILCELPLPEAKLNLIAPFLMGSKNWKNDAEEITRLLKAAGVSGNINLSGEELPELEKKMEIFNGNFPLPLGIANTEELLLYFVHDQAKVDGLLAEDLAFLKSQLRFNYNFSWMSTLMFQKRCGILGHAKFAASLARCVLWEFGIIPKVIGLVSETDRAINQSLELLESIKNQAEFKVLINPTYLEYVNAMKEANVDFSIGSIQDKPLSYSHKIPHLSLCGFNFYNQYNFIPWPLVGVRGVLGLLSELSVVMEEAFYMKESIANTSPS